MLKVGNSIDIQRTDGMCFDKIYVSSLSYSIVVLARSILARITEERHFSAK